ncbi:50S ribosomal protein L15 [Candidatus Gracilibacteria bacterium]|nr:50S ribosomal protein L15 [Candidatus Gracilibacteria bacterium]
MLTLNTLQPDLGARKTSKRLGRGNGSGKGTFCGKGCKGQNARSHKMGARFEGGQTPLFRRTPKLKGFSNFIFKTEYNVVNLKDLEVLAGKGIKEINKDVLLENKLIRKKKLGVKLLGTGELKSKVNITLDKVSDSAKEAVTKAGGTITIIEITK